MAAAAAPQQQFDTKKWPVVYPAYIDATKTIALVRRPPPRAAAAPSRTARASAPRVV